MKAKKTPSVQPEVKPIPLSVIRKITNRFKDQKDDFPLTFEYIMTACFPTVWNNIMKYGSDCYVQGYMQREKEEKKQNENT